jgi:hypothetical protein
MSEIQLTTGVLYGITESSATTEDTLHFIQCNTPLAQLSIYINLQLPVTVRLTDRMNNQPRDQLTNTVVFFNGGGLGYEKVARYPCHV